MPNFTAGTSFTDGVTNDVTAAKLNALVADAVPTSSLSLNSTTGTISNFTASTANITLGTIPTLTAGTTTSTAGVFTSGTVATLNSTTGVIPTLTSTTLITTGTGTAAAPAIVPTGDTNTGIFFPAADAIAFSEGGTESMRIDSSGNVGIGTASPAYPLVVSSAASTQIQIRAGNSNASSILLGDTDSATIGRVQYDHGTDSMAIWTNSAERLRIDSNGNVGIGNSSPSYLQHNHSLTENATVLALSTISNSSSAGSLGLATKLRVGALGASNNNGVSEIHCLHNLYNDSKSALKFLTNDGSSLVEALRIDSSGNVLIGATSGQSSERLLAQNDSATNPSFIAYSPSATFTGYVARLFADRNTSNSTYNFLSCTRVATAGDVFIIRDSGDAVNTNNSYGAISDIKLKENIEDAASQWNDIKSIQVRKFSFKNDEEHKRMLGLVAQEVELISPNLVKTVIDRDKDGNDLGTTTKEVKYSVLYMKAVKALQEAMGRIEQLESKVTALEAA